MEKFVDMHCDTAAFIYKNNENLFDSKGHISIEKLMKYKNPVQVFAIWLGKKYYNNNAFKETQDIIENFKNQIQINSDYISLTKNFYEIKNNNKISALLSIEGCEALEGNMDNLYRLYDMGIRLMTLTWNYKNCVGTGVMDSKLGGGLTSFGKDAVREMEKLGIIVDVSHLCDEGFYDVEKITQKPFAASHSNARTICPHKRNLKDNQIRIIADRGGIIGLNLYSDFLNSTGKASVDDVMRHVDYMLKICGEDHIALGCDFDGIDCTPTGLEDVTRLGTLFDRIEKEYGQIIASKIASDNFMRLASIAL